MGWAVNWGWCVDGCRYNFCGMLYTALMPLVFVNVIGVRHLLEPQRASAQGRTLLSEVRDPRLLVACAAEVRGSVVWWVLQVGTIGAIEGWGFIDMFYYAVMTTTTTG